MFVAGSLGPAREERPRDTIRRYRATGFFKHRLQTYKRRPILLPLLQRQAAGLPMPRLPAPLQRGHVFPDADRVRHPRCKARACVPH